MVPPIEPTRILLISQQVEPSNRHNRIFIPFSRNKESVPIQVPIIGKRSKAELASHTPQIIPIVTNTNAIIFEEI